MLIGVSMDKIFVTGAVELNQVLNFEMTAEMNEHAILKLEGLMNNITDESHSDLIGKKMSLICEEEGVNIPVFTGIIQETRLVFKGEECYIKLKCISSSYEFDQNKKCYFYQNKHMTYRQMLDLVSGKGRNILFTCGSGLELNTPLLQYEETDWEFCKRIASQFGSVVIPEITGEYPQISVGVIGGKQYQLEDTNNYKCQMEWGEYRKKRLLFQCNPEDFCIYTVSGSLNYMLGDKVWFKDSKKIVISKHVSFKNGLIQVEYKLGSEAVAGIKPFYNHRICGLCLGGTVKWTSKEKIKVKLDLDQNKNPLDEELFAFEYVPISGNIMYTMPEKGTKVQLYFSNEKENSGIVIGSVNEKIDYPEASVKIFQTKEGKRLDIQSTQIELTSEVSQISMALSDQLGINLFSQKDIFINANDSIKIRTGGNVTMDTPMGYHFENKKSGDCIDLSGNEMRMTTEKAVISGLPHKLGHKPEQACKDFGISNSYQYATNIMAGIPQGIAESTVSSAILGGLPSFQNPNKEHQVSDLIFLGRN